MASNAPVFAKVKPDPQICIKKYKEHHKKHTNGLVAVTRSMKEESNFHKTSVLICKNKTPIKETTCAFSVEAKIS